jgi:hypothetical protein
VKRQRGLFSSLKSVLCTSFLHPSASLSPSKSFPLKHYIFSRKTLRLSFQHMLNVIAT